MGRKYAKPPLVEAVCEIRLSDETKWDLTVAGLLFERVRNDFPHNEQRTFQSVEIIQNPEGIQQQIKSEERVLFFNESRNVFIQIGARMLAVNCLKPYPEWDVFRKYIIQAFNALKEIINIKGVRRLGLRYLNRIEFPDSLGARTVDLDHYFNYRPYLGDGLPQGMANFVLSVTLPYHDEREQCRVLLTNSLAEQPNHQAIGLDIDYSLAVPKSISPDEIPQWINSAHDTLEQVFEGCILDPTRVLFQEVSE